MRSIYLIAPWIRRFLMEHLVGERNLAMNTRSSYRDMLALLIPFVASKTRKPVDELCIEHFSADVVRLFLLHLEQDRKCSMATRNQRLAAIHAFALFIGMHNPEYAAWCGEIRAIPFKKTQKPTMCYLDKPEMDALLEAPDRRVAQGHRDHALLLFLYNTGARADEAAHITVNDLRLEDPPSVRILGKGNRVRYCPLWLSTAKILTSLVSHRSSNESVFLNRRKQPITRFGIHSLVKRYALRISQRISSLRNKHVSPHTLRHTTAVHLLRAGVDINTIRAWLGHVSLDTTNIYAEIDLDMKAKALARCEITETSSSIKHWRESRGVMAFLKAL